MDNWAYNPFFSGVMGPYLQLVGDHLVTTFTITFESHVCIYLTWTKIIPDKPLAGPPLDVVEFCVYDVTRFFVLNLWRSGPSSFA